MLKDIHSLVSQKENQIDVAYQKSRQVDKKLSVINNRNILSISSSFPFYPYSSFSSYILHVIQLVFVSSLERDEVYAVLENVWNSVANQTKNDKDNNNNNSRSSKSSTLSKASSPPPKLGQVNMIALWMDIL